jgi:hypothetical protein
MSNKLMVGLNFYPKDSKLIDLREICRKIKELEKWNIEYLFENIVIKISSHNDRVIIPPFGEVQTSILKDVMDVEHVSHLTVARYLIAELSGQFSTSL